MSRFGWTVRNRVSWGWGGISISGAPNTARPRSVKRKHGRLALSVDCPRSTRPSVTSVAMIALYFGFIGLIAFNRELLAIRLTDGLSLGILLGALVIVISWLLTRCGLPMHAISPPVGGRAPGWQAGIITARSYQQQ